MATPSARGFTLVEMTVVVVLAGVVTLGLLGFYLNSQATWMDASSQALAQRDATSIVEAITSRARDAAAVIVTPAAPDTILTFYKQDPSPPNSLIEPYSFWWSNADSLVHQGVGTGNQDDGPVAPSLVERFHFEMDPALPILHLRMLEVRSTQGEHVQVSTSFTLYNGPKPQ